MNQGYHQKKKLGKLKNFYKAAFTKIISSFFSLQKIQSYQSTLRSQDTVLLCLNSFHHKNMSALPHSVYHLFSTTNEIGFGVVTKSVNNINTNSHLIKS